MEEIFFDYLKRIRNELKAYKKESGVSTGDIAQDLNMAHQTILKLERGYGMTRVETAQRIEEYIKEKLVDRI